ncbi:TolC family protein [Longimicrobium sp.]|uniref:TolC family protein n=1 Tax=Longimicrobium sp. TaxID=2029185 RepID=UPI002E326758|nr:TolC family protein [Longimicrobium sp.]HEX6036734.1 TolC family protein [Longimicrobium sp.]
MSTSILARRAGLMALSLAAITAPAAAQQPAPAGPGLTMEQAVAAARENNPDMQATRNDAVASRAAVRAARADFLPSANASAGFGYTASGVQRFGSEVFGERPEYYSSNWNVGLSYDLSGAKLLQPRIARAQEQATTTRIAGYEANLEMQVRQQYLTALQAGEVAAQAQREVERTREHERLANAKLEVGSGTPLDVRRAQVERGRAEATLVQQQNTYETELLRLGLLMGVDLPQGTPLSSRFELFEPRWTADDLVRMALENNPNLLTARANTTAAQTQVRAARSAYLPSLSFQVGMTGSVYSAGDINPLVQQQLSGMQGAYASCNENNALRAAVGLSTTNCAVFDTSDPAVQDAVRRQVEAGNPNFPFGYERQPLQASMSISLPLFDGLSRERRIQEARVAESDARLAVTAQEQRLRSDVRGGLLSLQTAYRTAALQREVAANAAEELRMARERFRLGAATSLEVTDAQTRLAEAERAVIDAVYTYHKSLAALEALVSRSLR